MGVSSLLFHGDSRTQASWPAKHVYPLGHFNDSPPQKFELNTTLMAGRSSSPPRTDPRDDILLQNENSQMLLETNCKIYFGAAGVLGL